MRDFWNIPQNKRGNLGAEISFVENRLSPEMWQAIDDIRSIGDIGAHMDKDVDLIVDIEPKEAEILLRLIETLLEEWYVERHDREERLKALRGVAQQKLSDKQSAKKKSGRAATEEGSPATEEGATE